MPFIRTHVRIHGNLDFRFKLLQHYKSNKLIEVFMGRARVGPVIREEAANVTSQAVKSTK